MRQPEVKETLARLAFNAAATRGFFDEGSKGVRVRIEQGIVTFRPSNTMRGADVIAIERRPRRGVAVEISPGQEAKRLMARLFRAGLTEAQPYFALEPAPRGWFAIDHVAEPDPAPNQPLMMVSDFEPPPLPIDIALWRRFLRNVNGGNVIDADVWDVVRRMVRGAALMTARPQRGRVSQERQLAGQLLGVVEKNAAQLQAWCERQPEFGNDITALFAEIGIEAVPAANVVSIRGRRKPAEAEPTEIEEAQTNAPRRRPRRRTEAAEQAPPDPDWPLRTRSTPPDAPAAAETDEAIEHSIERILDAGTAPDLERGDPEVVEAETFMEETTESEEPEGEAEPGPEPEPVAMVAEPPETEPEADAEPRQDDTLRSVLDGLDQGEDDQPVEGEDDQPEGEDDQPEGEHAPEHPPGSGEPKD